MTASPEARQHGPDCTTAELGPFRELERYVFSLPGVSVSIEGKVFLNELLGLTGAEISLNKMPPGAGMPFIHKHAQNEETYIFIAGEGEFQVNGDIFDVREGSVVRVGTSGERCWRNTGSSDLIYVVVQAREGTCTGHASSDGMLVRKPVSWVRHETG